MSRVLLVIILFVGGLGLSGVAYHLFGNHMVRYVVIDGAISPDQREALLSVIAESDMDSELSEFKSLVEGVDWVRAATVARHWPDKLLIGVEPEHAIALWNDNAYLNQDGRVYESPYKPEVRLAQLYGPDGSEAEVMQQYRQINNALFDVGETLVLLELNDRGSWRFVSSHGYEVLLGKAEVMERLQRLLLVTAKVKDVKNIQLVDTRYANGVAIDWKESTDGMQLAETFNLQREQKL